MSASKSAANQLIQPRTLKGFRDFPPAAMIPRERLLEIARRVYRSYGFSPIDTPALEYSEILLGKGSDETDRQLYRFRDQGDRDVALRFDLTVPLARFAAQHCAELGTPFKRYQMATVWRGEKQQRGRYREFMQCDFDTIGTRSVVADIETGLVIHDLFAAIDAGEFTIRINNRQVLNGLLERLDLAEQSVPVLRALDKLAKIGPEKVAAEMQEQGSLSAEQATEVLKFAEINGSTDEILTQLEPLVAGSETGEEGVARLRELVAGLRAGGVPEERFEIDVAIARGLDYYTGIIFETFLAELPEIGSVCSGGRYDNLAGLYTKQELPGIGASLGLDRLLAALEELGRLEKVSTPAPVLIVYFDKERLAEYLKIAAALRRQGIAVELFPEPKKMGQQLKYADRRGFTLAVIAGEDEFAASRCQLKDLRNKQSIDVPLTNDCGELAEAIRTALG